MKKTDIALVTVGSVLIAVLLVILTSVTMQAAAAQCFSISQDLFPALNEAGVEYWLDWGTLLGARREGTMIAHDYDADIGMRESQFQQLKSQWNQIPALKGMRLYNEGNGLYRIRRGIGWVDVFRYDDRDVEQLKMTSQGNLEHSCKCDGKGHTTTRSIIFPLTKLKFGNVHAPAPNQTDTYLEHLYGSDWHIPRKNGGAAILNLVPLSKHT